MPARRPGAAERADGRGDGRGDDRARWAQTGREAALDLVATNPDIPRGMTAGRLAVLSADAP